MKTRNGFVSNSSSSSFVVAFPSKPKNAANVWKFLFIGKDGGLSVYDYDGLSYAQVSSIVFNDIEHENCKEATKKDIVEIFSSRYHYHPSCYNVFWDGKISDKDGGAWYEKCGRYCGNNQKLMNELKKLTIEDEKKEEELRKKENQIIGNGVGPSPKYAYEGGIDPYTKKPYTKKDIKTSKDYQDKMEKFKKTNKEYMEWNKQRWAARQAKWNKMTELKGKIAEEDAQNFLDDNKGKFIFIVEYSDNDGAQGCTMEHGDVFRNVPHVVISQH